MSRKLSLPSNEVPAHGRAQAPQLFLWCEFDCATMNLPMSAALAQSILKETFGFNEYRHGQNDAVSAILEGRDALVVMPTGAGKSLCFQLPALVLPGVTIVVSPLIALMKDQVDDLQERNIAATFINSSLSGTEIARRLDEVTSGAIKLLYIAPERFYDAGFLQALKNITVSLFAVDEAHCISEWGHDFRPSYLQLKKAIEAVGRPPVAALTATATPDVRDDIVRALGLNNPFVLVTGFDRPNLTYGVIRATPTEKIGHVVDLVKKITGPGIVYAGTRDTVDSIAEILRMHNVKALAYHAGMDAGERERNQQRFMNDEAQVIVATNAFGLGIDKPNVRLLIHVDMPGTLEAYYQEAGRAGRDGKASYAVMLHHPSDRYLREFFLAGENPEPDLIRAVYRYLTYQSGEVIYTTYSEILEGVGMKVPELSVSTALKILEQGGYVKRPHTGVSEAFVRLARPLAEVEAAVNPRAKVQFLVWKLFRDRFGIDLEEGVHFSAESIVQGGEVSRESLGRSLRALAEKGFIHYEPPFRGQEIRLLQQVAPQELNLDWAAIKAKRQREEEKLNRMENYAYAVGCRRAYILRYLGDENAKPKCDSCDNCL